MNRTEKMSKGLSGTLRGARLKRASVSSKKGGILKQKFTSHNIEIT